MIDGRRLRATAQISLAALFVSGCDIPEKVESQAARLDKLETQFTHLDIMSKVLEMQVDTLNLQATNQSMTELTLDGGARPVEDWAGQLIVNWEDVSAFGDGSRVSLSVGNPTLGTMEGLTIKAQWNGDAANNTEVKLADTLRAGYWNKVQFRLPGVKPDQIKTLSISITVNTVAFRR